MSNKNSWNKIWAFGLMVTGGPAVLLAQSPVQAVSAERQILLHIKFAELNQGKQLQFGANLLAEPGSRNNGPTGNGGTPSIAQALNLITLDPKPNLGALLKALQNESILRVVAEPNLVTTDGKEAKFMAGSEFPVPVAQRGASTGAVTLNGFTAPSLSTRTTESRVELGDGQSFVVAGLLNKQEESALSKLPFISSIPILGLFGPKDNTAPHSDLIMIVTPEIVPPGARWFIEN